MYVYANLMSCDERAIKNWKLKIIFIINDNNNIN